jgi:hypothetical protein
VYWAWELKQNLVLILRHQKQLCIIINSNAKSIKEQVLFSSIQLQTSLTKSSTIKFRLNSSHKFYLIRIVKPSKGFKMVLSFKIELQEEIRLTQAQVILIWLLLSQAAANTKKLKRWKEEMFDFRVLTQTTEEIWVIL